MSANEHYLRLQVAMVKQLYRITVQVDEVAGRLLYAAWFDHDDTALCAARDRADDIGRMELIHLCDVIRDHEDRPPPKVLIV